MFVLREAFVEDLPGLLEVAGHLDSVNLPADEAQLAKQLEHARKSFSGQLDVFRREYLFVLVEQETQRIVGTSMIHAQHGTRRAPHIFFDVIEDERYSETLDRHFAHRILRIGYNYNGPTEIGGLVLAPELRGHKLALGKWLSYVRFLYIGLYRENFRDQVLSELMPPLEADGTSLLWESLGRHFTGMSYQEADRISQHNKEFIRTLFPSEPIYLSLLPAKVQELVGVVGPETKGVETMLRRIGFQYARRIDPFDGGPHFIARTDDITLVRQVRRPRLVETKSMITAENPFALVSIARDKAPHFVAVGTRVRLEGDTVTISDEAAAALGVAKGDSLGVLTL